MHPTPHQGVEYIMGLLLFYAAVHRTGASAGALAGGGFAILVVAAISPGRLAARTLLGPRARRAADLALAAGAAVLIALFTRSDLQATLPLIVVGLVLLRLGLSRRPPPADRTRSPSRPLDSAQPTINRVARAAGIFVRNRRARR
jgi:hypothetical protein